MQQQTPQEQCGNQPQLQQSVMLCPVQYVYESPVIMPQRQEDQTQRNQIIINVKNPPPWIQNRPQNQVVYMPQLPNNYQPYIHPQMIQNSIYHPQMTYQIQPMLAQDNRQFIQIPNINHYNTVQNATAQISNEETERMPLLTQMLNQKANANANRAQIINNVRPNITPTVSMIRPVMQNQQVQTDNVSPNIKGRPRNVTPQIITINSIQQQQLANQKQAALMNVRPTNIRNDVPQHIRTKIPSSISVKSITRPALPRTLVRPFDVMPAPQNFYYNPIIMPAPNTESKSIMTNTDMQYNVKPMHTTTTVPMQYQTSMSNGPPFAKMTKPKSPRDTQKLPLNTQQNHNKTITAASVKSNANPVKTEDNNDKRITETRTSNTETQTQTEEKLIRNTVFVQARGRVLNDKETIQNQSLKRTIDDRVKEEAIQKQVTSNDTKIPEEAVHISKKIKKAVTENSSVANEIAVNSPTANSPMNIQTQQSRISNLLVNADNVQKTGFNTPQSNKADKVPESLNLVKSKESVKDDKDSNQSNSPKPSISKQKASLNKSTKKTEDIKALSKISDKVNNNSVANEETNIEEVKKKEGKITVLTHVLEGYIIQESNVAFPIQKPTTNKDIKKELDSLKSQDQNKFSDTSTKEDNSNEKHPTRGYFPWKYLNTSIESEKEMEFAVVEKGDPFANLKKSTVESWTTEQLVSHLEKCKWTETAAKLSDEEIDGESILLVKKEQLVAIGVSEEHADAIIAFAAS